MGRDAVKLRYDSDADFLEAAFEKGTGVAYDTDDERLKYASTRNGKPLALMRSV